MLKIAEILILLMGFLLLNSVPVIPSGVAGIPFLIDEVINQKTGQKKEKNEKQINTYINRAIRDKIQKTKEAGSKKGINIVLITAESMGIQKDQAYQKELIKIFTEEIELSTKTINKKLSIKKLPSQPALKTGTLGNELLTL